MYGERPAWYHRVYSLATSRKRNDYDKYPTRPGDYDEDLSELESEASCSSRNGCEYDGDEYCTKHDGSGAESDSSSDSGGGSDIDGYYQMKRERKERKQDLKEQKQNQEETAKEDLEFETRYEKEVKEVLAKLQAAKKKPAPLNRIGGRMFKLFSVDHAKYGPHRSDYTRYIECWSDDEYDTNKQTSPDRKQRQLEGHIYMMSEDICQLDRFIPPKLPSAKAYQLKADGGRWTFDVQFIDDNYLILKIPRELVFVNQRSPIPPDTPRFFTYYAICERHMVSESKRRAEKKERRRSASPE